jgi:hypothetical protein
MRRRHPVGVKVKLADTREVLDKKYRAGDVVEVESGDARLLVAIGAGTVVDETTPVSSGGSVPEAVPGNAGVPKDRPAAGDDPETGAGGVPAQIKPGPAGRKG